MYVNLLVLVVTVDFVDDTGIGACARGGGVTESVGVLMPVTRLVGVITPKFGELD